MHDLQIVGPKRAGLLDQHMTMAWKFLSKRFGMYGEAFQVSEKDLVAGKNENDVARKVMAAGRKMHRRLEGKNGWLWYTIFGEKEKVRKLEEDMALNHVRVPSKPKWYHKLVLKRMFGYSYPAKDPYENRWED